MKCVEHSMAALTVALIVAARAIGLRMKVVAFDPFLHQPGYAPDRASRIRVERRGTAASEMTVDRAEGVRAGPLTVYQAIPTGLALNVEIAPHAFDNHEAAMFYDENAAKAAWTKTMAFLRTHLPAG